MPVPIQILVNGERREVPSGLNLRSLLLHLRIDPQRVAVELNRSIIPKALWDSTPIEAGAALEIVEFVGGG